LFFCNFFFQEAALSGLYFSTAPDRDESFRVGDQVEVFCDHDDKGERIRDWLIGTIVQVDPKMLAIQFQENVYLTDGWMVPDHVLWCPKGSNNIRKPQRRRRKRPAGGRLVRPQPPSEIDDED
jgi:hypothetical protein